MNDLRAVYETFRHHYRKLRREDAQWRPDPYANRREPRPEPRADQFVHNVRARGAGPRMADAIEARPHPNRVERGPRACWYANWRPAGGRYRGMTLSQRVAFRRAQAQIADLEAQRRELAFDPGGKVWMQAAETLEAPLLRNAAMREYDWVHYARANNQAY